MDDVIKLFMWGYQHHIQDSLEFEAGNLFKLIDARLKPKVFLLGLLVNDNAERHKICIEPEDCGYKIECIPPSKYTYSL